MEAMTLMVLGILALGALVAAAWAMAARGKIAAELGECRVELAGARAEGAQRLEFVRRQEAAWDAREREVVGLTEALATARAETGAAIEAQLRSASEANRLLRDETGKLVRALREPHVRGRYGELQLRRVAELAGMSAYCDFCEQDRTVDGEGNPLKPDMV